MTSSSGRDQFDQRLEANRQRFLREIGERVGAEAGKREWRHLIVFGAEPHVRELARGLGPAAQRLHSVPQDLISIGEGQLAGRVEAEVRELHRARQDALIRELGEAIGSSPGAALGPQETLQALAEGRVRHLILDAEHDYEGGRLEQPVAPEEGGDEIPVSERMIERAVTTDAEVTCVEDGAAAALEQHEGVAALLRY